MAHALDRYPEIAQASPELQLAVINELWEMVRRSGNIAIPEDHIQELGRRLDAVRADPSSDLDPSQARALLRTR